jgi:HEAT repeat protein
MLIVVLACALAALSPQNPPVDDKAADQALEAFKVAFKAQAEGERAEAVLTLAESVHLKTLARLSSILSSSDGPKVRSAAAKGMGLFGALKKQAVAYLSGAFSSCSKEPQVQVSVLQALSSLGDLSALSTIHRAFDEKELVVVKAALSAAAILRNAGSIDPLIALLARTEKSYKAKSGGATNVSLPSGGLSVAAARPEDVLKALQEMMEATNTSLQIITEQQLSTSMDWQAWWNRSRATFKSK